MTTEIDNRIAQRLGYSIEWHRVGNSTTLQPCIEIDPHHTHGDNWQPLPAYSTNIDFALLLTLPPGADLRFDIEDGATFCRISIPKWRDEPIEEFGQAIGTDAAAMAEAYCLAWLEVMA